MTHVTVVALRVCATKGIYCACCLTPFTQTFLLIISTFFFSFFRNMRGAWRGYQVVWVPTFTKMAIPPHSHAWHIGVKRHDDCHLYIPIVPALRNAMCDLLFGPSAVRVLYQDLINGRMGAHATPSWYIWANIIVNRVFVDLIHFSDFWILEEIAVRKTEHRRSRNWHCTLAERFPCASFEVSNKKMFKGMEGENIDLRVWMFINTQFADNDFTSLFLQYCPFLSKNIYSIDLHTSFIITYYPIL